MTELIRSYFVDDFSLMLPCSGADGGTSFPDRSPRAKVFTPYWHVKTVTSQYKWYGSSGYFSNVTQSDVLVCPYHSDFDLSSADFALDCWFNRLSNTPGSTIYGLLIGKRQSGADWDWGLELNAGTALNFRWGDDAAGARALAVGGASLGTWNHALVVRDGNTLTGYLNGQAGGTATISGTIRNRTLEVRVGRSTYVDSQFHGYLQDLRLIKHHAVFETGPDVSALEPGVVDDRLTYPGDGFDVGSTLVDLQGVGAPQVTLFNWADPNRYARCRPGADRRWALRVPPGIQYGLYYLSRDPRCAPIAHGPYTAE